MKRFIIIFAIMSIILPSCNNSPEVDKAQIVLDNIASRKSVRSYTNEQVPDEMIEKLLRAAMAAPTAMNTQPWEFIVIKERASLDALAAKLRYAKMLSQAPLAIVVCAHTEQVLPDGSRRALGLWEHDASAATQNILLAAEALGLGAVWTAATDERGQMVSDALGLPADVKSLCVIPIGFPAGDEKPKDKWKPEKIHYEKW